MAVKYSSTPTCFSPYSLALKNRHFVSTPVFQAVKMPCNVKKEIRFLILLSFAVLEEASGQSEPTPAIGAFPNSDIYCAKAKLVSKVGWTTDWFCFRSPEHLTQKGGHPVHQDTSDMGEQHVVLLPALRDAASSGLWNSCNAGNYLTIKMLIQVQKHQKNAEQKSSMFALRP